MFTYNCSNLASTKEKNRETLNKFFEELLLEHGGAYTLFGSKPATIEDLIDMSPENYTKLQEYLTAHPEIPTFQIERYLEEGWDLLQQNPVSISNRFILTEVNAERYNLLVFLNTELAIQSIKEHYSEFKRVAGADFDPTTEIENLRSGRHDLWRQIFNDFICQGILLGYGEKNAKLFQKLYEDRVTGTLEEEYLASENTDPRIKADCYLNETPFRLPIFVMFDKNESEKLVTKYKEEREQIKKFYIKKNFLDMTLSTLKK